MIVNKKNIPNPIRWPKLSVELKVPTIGPHTLETFVACVTVIICTILMVTCKAVDKSLEYWKGH